MRRTVALTLFGLALSSSVWGAERAVAVSPGSPTGALIGDACPTFSWGAVSGARSYELVVYGLGDGTEGETPVLRQRFAGSVFSWTPSLDSCLARGSRYAWSVRAFVDKSETGASQWSAPSLFEVAAGPSEAEFEEALAVVQRYLAIEDDSDVEAEGESEVVAEGASDSAGAAPAGVVIGTEPPAPKTTVGPPALVVDLAVVAGGFKTLGDVESGRVVTSGVDVLGGDVFAGRLFGDGSLLSTYAFPVGRGIQENLSLSLLTGSKGWTICHQSTYDTTIDDAAIIAGGCVGSYLMLACRSTGSDSLIVAAADTFDVVTQVDGAGTGDHHVSAGVGWYYTPDKSWGFFSAGETVDRNSCDTIDGFGRLCWHTLPGVAGYRCSFIENLNASSDFERLILVR